MDNTISLKRRWPFTHDEDAFAPYYQSDIFSLTSDEVVSSSLLPEQHHILCQAADILQISVTDIISLASPISDQYILERAAHILNVPPQSLQQLAYRAPEGRRQKRIRHSSDHIMPQYSGGAMDRAFQEKAALPHTFHANAQTLERDQRQLLPLSPSQHGPSFLDSTTAGVAECLGSFAYCPLTSTYEPRTDYHGIPPSEPSHQFNGGAYSVDMTPSPVGEMCHALAGEYTTSPVSATWMLSDDTNSGSYIQGYPAMQPTAPALLNVQPTMIQPSTRLETMYYPNDRQLGFPKSEEAETSTMGALHVVTTDLANHSPDPQILYHSPILVDTSSATAALKPHPSVLLPAGVTMEAVPAAVATAAPPVAAETKTTRADYRAMTAMAPALVEGQFISQAHNSISQSPVQSLQQSVTYQASQQPHDQVPAAPYGSETEESQPSARPPAARRGPFKDQKEREKTAQTRKFGSCIRCRMQRIRCNAQEGDYHGECMGCKKSLGRTWRLPCLRLKIGDVELSKPCQVKGHEWTLRWKENSVLNDIGGWASSEVRVIRLTEGYTDDFVEFRVREFIPKAGDSLRRSWVTPTGEVRSVDIPAYAIVDTDTIVPQYKAYIKKGLTKCCHRVLDEHKGELIWWTYSDALRLSRLPSPLSVEERKVLSDTLELWMAVRLTTRSFEIIGPETLGMPPNILDETNPSCGKIPIPPVMGAQLDSSLIHEIQFRSRRTALEGLHKLITENKAKSWLTTYLIIFILLHNTALLMKHDASYARKHGMNRRFARREKVQQYYMGATTLLAYFHYCNKGAFPFSDDIKDDDIRNLTNLDEESIQCIYRTRSYVISKRKEWQDLRDSNAYEDDFYFVSQLYEVNWQPRSMAI